MKTLLFLLLFLPIAILAQDISIDEKMGAESARQVQMQMGIYDLPNAAEYIEAIGNRLVNSIKQPFNFHFYLIDSPIPNAFALPGGYVYITRGLLSLANSEDEIGGVIGHEIAHVLERHSVKQSKKSILPALLMVPGALIGTISSGLGNMINAPIALTGQLYLSSYSRGQEKDADAIGVRLAAASGYDPLKLAVILSDLTNAVEYVSGEKEKRSYFDDHPMTDDRVKDIKKTSEKYQVANKPPFASSQLEFYNKLEGLCFGENPAQGIFKKNIFLHPELKLVLEFPDEWKTANTPTAVGAYDKDQKSMVFLGISDTAANPVDVAKKIETAILEKYKLNAEESRQIMVDGLPAYYLQYEDKSNEKFTFISLLYVSYENFLYQIAGVGSADHKSQLSKSVLSFRKITPDELGEITQKVIQVATAKQGEKLDDFNKRTQNVWTPAFTAIANNINPEEPLKENQALKIALEKPYIPKSGK